MQDDAHGGGKLAWQAADQLPEGLHGAGGPANYDNAPTFHAGLTGEQRFHPDAGNSDLPSMKLDTGLSIWKNRWTIRRTTRSCRRTLARRPSRRLSALERCPETRDRPATAAR